MGAKMKKETEKETLKGYFTASNRCTVSRDVQATLFFAHVVYWLFTNRPVLWDSMKDLFTVGVGLWGWGGVNVCST